MSDVTKVTVYSNGPLVISGNVEICNEAGEVVRSANKISLCRCGQSEVKPYCDGTHKRCGFQAPTAE
jgi:CDGSH-type Zn-finger protein